MIGDMHPGRAEMPNRLMRRARRAYELGRLRGAAARALLLCVGIALIGTWLLGRGSFFYAPISFVLWCAAWWRGGVLLQSAYFGLAAGGITMLFPMGLLRPCCRDGAMGEVVCTMPEMCVWAGAMVSIPLTVLAMRRSPTQKFEAAVGLMLGVLSFAAVKCSALFLGEALGLIGGLMLGIALVTAAHSLVQRPA